MIDVGELLGGCISAARSVLKGVDADARVPGGNGTDARVAFLESQLAHIIKELTGWLTDIESGMSLSDLDFASEDDFQDMLEMMSVQIQNLKAQIRSFREVGR